MLAANNIRLQNLIYNLAKRLVFAFWNSSSVSNPFSFSRSIFSNSCRVLFVVWSCPFVAAREWVILYCCKSKKRIMPIGIYIKKDKTKKGSSVSVSLMGLLDTNPIWKIEMRTITGIVSAHIIIVKYLPRFVMLLVVSLRPNITKAMPRKNTLNAVYAPWVASFVEVRFISSKVANSRVVMFFTSARSALSFCNVERTSFKMVVVLSWAYDLFWAICMATFPNNNTAIMIRA